MRRPGRRLGGRIAGLDGRIAGVAAPLALAALAALLAPVPAFGQAASGADSSFAAFLPEFEAATRAMLGGDVSPWLALLSTEPGGTLFSPFGEVVRGRPALEARYRAVAQGFAPGPARIDVEYLDVEVAGDLASVVSLERTAFHRVGSDQTHTGHTRATMIFRREGGGWRLRHRHMDHLGAPEE